MRAAVARVTAGQAFQRGNHGGKRIRDTRVTTDQVGVVITKHHWPALEVTVRQ